MVAPRMVWKWVLRHFYHYEKQPALSSEFENLARVLRDYYDDDADGTLDQIVSRRGRKSEVYNAAIFRPGDIVDVYDNFAEKSRGWFMVLSVNQVRREISGLLPEGTTKEDFLIVRNYGRR
jgi:hypothetical protein